MGQAGKFSAPPSCSYLLSYVKENNKEPGHYDHKHSTSLHASKNGALDYESTLSFCTNRQFNQTSVINGSMKRHSDNGIIRTQVLSILCHRGKCTTTRAVTEPSLCQYPQEKQDTLSGIWRRLPAPPRSRVGPSQGQVLHTPLIAEKCLVGCAFPTSHHCTWNKGRVQLNHPFYPK